MTRNKKHVTPAIRELRAKGVKFSDHNYRYEAGGGTRISARELGVEEHTVIKTLIMQNEKKEALIVLMHGDREVSTKALAREIGTKMVQPCDPAVADTNSGYQVGGTSPFGTRKAMPVFCERSIEQLPLIYINGGARGYLISLDPKELVRVLNPTLVNVQR
ncbi:MAG: Cys-tRNA(Pro) deacylase [Gammaproteobacteria bacterium]|nr:Cys-tRNA(Pro) deacylase [Gammaproteobacteria bacterium]